MDDSPRRCHECFPRHPTADVLHAQALHPVADSARRPVHRAAAAALEQLRATGASRASRSSTSRTASCRRDRLAGRRASSAPRNRFGFFGQFTDFKGADVLLEAIEAACGRRLRRAALDPRREPRARRRGVPGPVSPAARGVRRQGALVGQYDRADCEADGATSTGWWCPSIWWETGPLVVGEAFQHGRPVICSDIGGMAEKVTDGVNGLHFRRGDADEPGRRDRAGCHHSGTVGGVAPRDSPRADDARARRVAQFALPATVGVRASVPRSRPPARTAVRVCLTRSDEPGTGPHTRRPSRHPAERRHAAGRIRSRRRARGRPAGGPLRGWTRAGPVEVRRQRRRDRLGPDVHPPAAGASSGRRAQRAQRQARPARRRGGPVRARSTSCGRPSASACPRIRPSPRPHAGSGWTVF